MAVDRKAIVVTGVGSYSACGADLDALDRTLQGGIPPLAEVDRSRGFHRAEGSRLALLCPAAPAAPWIPPMKARRMSPPSRFAVVAAKQALIDADLPIPQSLDPAMGVAVATAFGPSSFTQRLLDQSFDEGPQAISPMLFTECVANAAPAQVSIHCLAGGPNHAIAARESGPLVAVGRALSALRSGKVQRMLAGNAEEITPLLHALLDRFDALAGARNRNPERARPLAENRDGCHAAEGATLWLMETEAAAVARGARIRARVLGVAGAFDPSASPVGWGRGHEKLAASLRSFLERIDVPLESLDLVISGASGSIGGDRLESETLQATWSGRPLPSVVAPKAVTGEYGGPFLAAALRILEGQGGRVLVSGLGSGGVAGWLVLERS